VLLRRSGPGWHLLGCAAVVAGFVGGRAVVAELHAAWWPDPTPVHAPTAVKFMTRNTRALLPPVLGSADTATLDRAYDTFYAAIPRTGRVPEPLLRLADWSGQEPLVFVEPAGALAPEEAAAFRDRLVGGATALVAVSSSHIGFEAMQSLLAGTPLGIEYVDAAARTVRIATGAGTESTSFAGGRIRSYEAAVGKGRLVVVVGAEHWARDRLGHAFAVPGAATRELYDALYAVLDRLGPPPVLRRSYELL
jgi:hypothetical protein